MNDLTDQEARLLSDLRVRAQASGQFGTVALAADRLTCTARESTAPAEYAVWRSADGWRIALSTADRWLSESIEGQLVESRESLESLLLDELKDLDWTEGELKVRHFRDEARVYVFEVTLAATASPKDLDRLATVLRAFEQTFAQLGDMSGTEGG